MDNTLLAREIESRLVLSSPAIAMTFADKAPDGFRMFQDDVPSFCSFWRRAESELFYAPADKHFNCLVGAMVMGFEIPEDLKPRCLPKIPAALKDETW